jgi:16S rRNA (guanine966-N2)-methyltransferase
MRVIAGSAGGIRLETPRHDLRPTMDRVREAAFSALGDFVIGAHVLDLFAGSGGYGIEALSRGADEAVFVDDHPQSIGAIRSNLLRTRLDGKVFRDDAFRFLQKHHERHRLVFADPPYARKAGDRDFAGELLENEFLVSALEPAGLLVLECSAIKEVSDSQFWEVTRERKYGATKLLFCIHRKFPV